MTFILGPVLAILGGILLIVLGSLMKAAMGE
jgi:hypothetical protein